MSKSTVKVLLILLGAIGFGLATALAVQVWMIRSVIQGAGDIVEGLVDGELVGERVDILAGIDLQAGGYALVLGDLVTGRGPILITDAAAIRALAPDLWYHEERRKGGMFNTARNMQLKAGPQKEIATLLRNGAAIGLFTCPEARCDAWLKRTAAASPAPGEAPGGITALRARALLPGLAVEHVTGHYESYDAYLAAHEAIAGDPARWFAVPGAEILSPREERPASISVTLPVELLAFSPSESRAEDEAASEAALLALGQSWLGDAEGRVRAEQSWPMALLIETEPQARPADAPAPENPLRELPAMSYRERRILIELPAAALEAVTARIDLSGFAAPDLLRLEDALHHALQEAGYDTSCMPGCARVETARINHGADLHIRPAQGWQLESWRILPAPP